MDYNLDPFDDILSDRATKTARAGGKFQPKSKAQPKKKLSESVPSTQSLQPVNSGENKSIAPVGLSLASSEATNLLKNNEFSFVEAQFSDDNRSFAHPSSKCVATTQSVDPIDGLHSHNVMPDGNGDWHSSFGKSPIENADIFFGLESLDDFLSQTTSEIASNADRSPPKTKIRAKDQNKFPTSIPINPKAEASLPPSETATIHVSGSENREEGLGLPVVSPVNESTFKESNGLFPHTYPEVSMTQDALTCVEATVSTSGGDFQVDNRMAGEEVEAFRCWNTLDIMSELTTSSGRKTRKFQPKSKAQIDKEKTCTSIPNPDSVESISCPVDVQSVPSEAECVDEGSIPAFSLDEVPDFFSFTFHDSVPTNLTSELPVNEERTKVSESSQSDSPIPTEHVKAVPPMPGKVVSQRAQNGRRKTPTVPDLSTNHQNDSTSGRENATGRSLRPLRKRTNACELIDEAEDEAHNDGDLLAESPSGSIRNEGDKSDEDYQIENEPEDRRSPGKSKKPVAEKEKPVRKRKKANEVPDQSTKKPPKKFSHSTRQNRRKVNKVLLQTPEDEIDPQKLNFRDLILLAEYKERISKKEATTSETPLTSHSAGNSFMHFNEDETFASEQAGGSDEQGSPRVQEPSYINYQTYMNKTPTARWSKQDTELFYEAVQQFGTDLSLIQQLFPDRTCRQVKLKFKKEERHHPLRLHEALTSRTKDLTRFEQVVKRLQQLAAEEKQNNNRDDSTGLTGEEVELTPDINEEAKSEQQIEEAVENVEPDLSEVQSPIISDNSEDELYRWNQYKSEF